MYKITVPIMTSTLYRSNLDQIVKELHRLDAERVLLAIEPLKTAKQRQEQYRMLKKYCVFFKEHGFEVGAWLWTFWYEGDASVTYMHSVSGNNAAPFVCPSDAAYRRIVCDDLINIAKCGVDLILFDDDFRFTHLAEGMCCACDNHLSMIAQGCPTANGGCLICLVRKLRNGPSQKNCGCYNRSRSNNSNKHNESQNARIGKDKTCGSAVHLRIALPLFCLYCKSG